MGRWIVSLHHRGGGARLLTRRLRSPRVPVQSARRTVPALTRVPRRGERLDLSPRWSLPSEHSQRSSIGGSTVADVATYSGGRSARRSVGPNLDSVRCSDHRRRESIGRRASARVAVRSELAGARTGSVVPPVRGAANQSSPTGGTRPTQPSEGWHSPEPLGHGQPSSRQVPQGARRPPASGGPDR